ncbi:hypothetical protein PoB_004144800 [Plakobranchus ocellatus]|uniref:Uncharacterized protein n=1 Tax=Plakobranchus ocellatus TaxID=259542 RepID=A0AAV4B720_9GAST|nr:hypothetical protein PoB_004144800 [Plakobranchus ocellatus]
MYLTASYSFTHAATSDIAMQLQVLNSNSSTHVTASERATHATTHDNAASATTSISATSAGTSYSATPSTLSNSFTLAVASSSSCSRPCRAVPERPSALLGTITESSKSEFNDRD